MAGEEHPKFAECLSDYAFYLLNVDGVAASVEVYRVCFPLLDFSHAYFICIDAFLEVLQKM